MDNQTLNSITNLTRDELLDIVVALDITANKESQEGHNDVADRLRTLKWKAFALMAKMEKEAA